MCQVYSYSEVLSEKMARVGRKRPYHPANANSLGRVIAVRFRSHSRKIQWKTARPGYDI